MPWDLTPAGFMALLFPSSFQTLCRSSVLAGCVLLADVYILGAQPPSLEAPLSQKTEDLVSRLVKDSQRHQIIRTSDPKAPLRQAENYAVGLANDLSSYNRWLLQIIQAYVKKNQIEDAEYLVRRLPGYGGAMAHAEMALFYSRTHREAEAEPHLKAALTLLTQAAGLPAEMARIQCILALHHLGRAQETASLVAQLGRLSLLSLETKMHEEDLVPAISLLQAKRNLVTVPEQGEDERRARYLLACAKQHFEKGSADIARAFLETIGEMSVENGLPNAHRVLVDLARVAWMGGEQKLARKSLNLFLKLCESYGQGADWKPLFMADAVDLLISWDEKDEARQWLNAAESGVAKIFVIEAPATFLALANLHEKLGDRSGADQLAILAAKAGASYHHPRVGVEASVRVCLYFADHNRDLPDDIFKILSKDPVEVTQ